MRCIFRVDTSCIRVVSLILDMPVNGLYCFQVFSSKGRSYVKIVISSVTYFH